jgi:hypothetical protein
LHARDYRRGRSHRFVWLRPLSYSGPVVVGTSIDVVPYPAPVGPRLTARVVRAVWAIATTLSIVSIVIVVASLSTPAPEPGYVRGSVAAFGLAWATIGARIALRFPGNVVGWFMLAAGVGFGLLAASQEFVIATVGMSDQATTAGAVLRLVRASTFLTSIFAGLTVLYFPNGHLPSRPWLLVAALVIVTNGLGLAIVAATAPPGASGTTSPFADFERLLLQLPAYGIARFGGPLALAACGGALLIRVRRAGPLERQQLKWIAAAGSLAVVTNLVANALPPAAIIQLLQVMSLLAFPLAVGVAMTRYRLYDIDVILNRTLVYAIVSGFLAGLTAALSGAIQATFIAVTGQRSDAAIIITTLMLVGVFVPLREVVQRAVDARFKRAAKGLTGLRSFASETRQVAAITDPERLVGRLLKESVAAFDSAGGTAELHGPKGLYPVTTVEASGFEPQVTATINDGERALARVRLGRRATGEPYSKRQLNQLEDAADAVAEVLAPGRATRG